MRREGAFPDSAANPAATRSVDLTASKGFPCKLQTFHQFVDIHEYIELILAMK
jgi:hypothetical protein